MALFKNKKKAEPVVEYSEIEQGAPPLPALPESPMDVLTAKIEKVLENQKTIVGNQQVILDAVEKVGQLMISLAEEAPAPEAEPTQEEIQAAILAARAAKKGARA